jgi:hypothetical protein
MNLATFLFCFHPKSERLAVAAANSRGRLECQGLGGPAQTLGSLVFAQGWARFGQVVDADSYLENVQMKLMLTPMRIQKGRILTNMEDNKYGGILIRSRNKSHRYYSDEGRTRSLGDVLGLNQRNLHVFSSKKRAWPLHQHAPFSHEKHLTVGRSPLSFSSWTMDEVFNVRPTLRDAIKDIC